MLRLSDLVAYLHEQLDTLGDKPVMFECLVGETSLWMTQVTRLELTVVGFTRFKLVLEGTDPPG